MRRTHQLWADPHVLLERAVVVIWDTASQEPGSAIPDTPAFNIFTDVSDISSKVTTKRRSSFELGVVPYVFEIGPAWEQ